MAVNLGEAFVALGARVGPLVDGLRRAEAAARTSSTRMGAAFATARARVNGLAASIGRGLVGAIRTALPFLGAAGLGLAVTQSIRLFAAQEEASARLRNALRDLGDQADIEFDRLRGVASELQRLTGVSDDAIVEVQSLIAAFGGQGEALDRATRATLDFAAALGTKPVDAARLLARAVDGNVSILTRYGIQIDQAVPETERFAVALEQIEERFGGTAEAIGQSLPGILNRVREAFGDVLEEVGGLIVSFVSMEGAGRSLEDRLLAIADALKEFRDTPEFIELRNAFNGFLGSVSDVFAEMGNTILQLGQYDQQTTRSQIGTRSLANAFRILSVLAIGVQSAIRVVVIALNSLVSAAIASAGVITGAVSLALRQMAKQALDVANGMSLIPAAFRGPLFDRMISGLRGIASRLATASSEAGNFASALLQEGRAGINGALEDIGELDVQGQRIISTLAEMGEASADLGEEVEPATRAFAGLAEEFDETAEAGSAAGSAASAAADGIDRAAEAASRAQTELARARATTAELRAELQGIRAERAGPGEQSAAEEARERARLGSQLVQIEREIAAARSEGTATALQQVRELEEQRVLLRQISAERIRNLEARVASEGVESFLAAQREATDARLQAAERDADIRRARALSAEDEAEAERARLVAIRNAAADEVAALEEVADTADLTAARREDIARQLASARLNLARTVAQEEVFEAQRATERIIQSDRERINSALARAEQERRAAQEARDLREAAGLVSRESAGLERARAEQTDAARRLEILRNLSEESIRSESERLRLQQEIARAEIDVAEAAADARIASARRATDARKEMEQELLQDVRRAFDLRLVQIRDGEIQLVDVVQNIRSGLKDFVVGQINQQVQAWIAGLARQRAASSAFAGETQSVFGNLFSFVQSGLGSIFGGKGRAPKIGPGDVAGGFGLPGGALSFLALPAIIGPLLGASQDRRVAESEARVAQIASLATSTLTRIEGSFGGEAIFGGAQRQAASAAALGRATAPVISVPVTVQVGPFRVEDQRSLGDRVAREVRGVVPKLEDGLKRALSKAVVDQQRLELAGTGRA